MGRTFNVRVGSYTPPGGGAVSAPTGPFTSGSQVGVPTGTTLATRSALGASTGSGTKLLTHPVSNATNNRSVTIWENILFTGAFTVDPPVGQTWLFRNCRWVVPTAFWVVEVGNTGATTNQMTPSVVFERCSFETNGDSGVSVGGSNMWLIGCDIVGMPTPTPNAGSADGWQGANYSVAIDCNIVAGTRSSEADPHSDGMQSMGGDDTTVYHCWVSAGVSAGRNAAMRMGTEFGPINNVQVYYSGIDNGGWAMQFDGGKSGGVITGARLRGNRWTRTAGYGPVDFVNVTVDEWVDNAFFDGVPILQP